jgi:thiamine biosynthesis lipoprotein
MIKRVFCIVLVAVLLAGCTGPGMFGPKRYTATFLTLFDTVTTVVGFADSQEEFAAMAQQIHDKLQTYHRLFDIYNTYEGINNLKTLNDAAGGQPVKVDRAIIELLKSCKEYARLTGGSVNVAMGSVLQLWHEAREAGLRDPANAYLPDRAALEAAAEHTDLNQVIIDEEESTVRIADPALRLDVGAIAKGWAAQRVAEQSPEGLLISVGGNVCATGPKSAQGDPWVVGIQDPEDANRYLHTIGVTGGSVVTSGDYQRAYTVAGKTYHHIIDPKTLYPSEYFHSVTIVCADSGLADALSTALFVLPLQEGMALLQQCGAMAMWVGKDGTVTYSPGFQALICE